MDPDRRHGDAADPSTGPSSEAPEAPTGPSSEAPEAHRFQLPGAPTVHGSEGSGPALDHGSADAAAVERQLDRRPRGRWGVAARCHLGIPAVIESAPRMPDGTPFPTLYWLSCPVLVKRVARLEGEGWMAAVNDSLAGDAALRERLAAALRRYRRSRDRHGVIADSGAPPGGGPGRVKCLHAHVAHELAGGVNPVGARALAAAGHPDCRVPCVPAPSGPCG